MNKRVTNEVRVTKKEYLSPHLIVHGSVEKITLQRSLRDPSHLPGMPPPQKSGGVVS